MRSRNNVSMEPVQVPIIFKDVAAYFSEEEWNVLQGWQKDLYKNVVKEIHRSMIALGFQIVNPSALLRIRRSEALNTRDKKRRLDIRDPITSCLESVNPDILLRITADEDACDRVQCAAVGSGNNSGRNADVVITSVVSCTIKEELETSSMDGEFSESGQHVRSPTGFKLSNIKHLLATEQESGGMLRDHNFEANKRSPSSISEHVITKAPISPIFEKEKEEEKETHCEENPVFETTECSTECRSMSKKNNLKCYDKPRLRRVLSRRSVSRMTNVSEDEAHTETRSQAGINKQLGEEQTIHCESRSSFEVPSSLYSQTYNGASSENNILMNIQPRNAKVFASQPNLFKGWSSPVFDEYDDNTSDIVGHIPSEKVTDAHISSEVESYASQGYKINIVMPPKVPKLNNNGKSFVCAECEKVFRHKDSLIKHQRIHTGERPYQCTDCERGFARKESLIIHTRTHTGERPFTCAECDLSFINKGNLITHQRTHTGDKPYKCSECRKCFSVKIGLIRHKLTHTGEKPYKCTECEKCFTQKQNLIKHQRTHSGEKPYRCSEWQNVIMKK
ncbi:zinc finger protein 432-like isoform X2 [Pleurodeles waltl]|uniref:zinc finger protein 432-like isoform X2 n=1 Tax=Pleurodeles waltl TaxID=8319 RepID=UPI003709AE2A